jgi:hypothetical protein
VLCLLLSVWHVSDVPADLPPLHYVLAERSVEVGMLLRLEVHYLLVRQTALGGLAQEASGFAQQRQRQLLPILVFASFRVSVSLSSHGERLGQLLLMVRVEANAGGWSRRSIVAFGRWFAAPRES